MLGTEQPARIVAGVRCSGENSAAGSIGTSGGREVVAARVHEQHVALVGERGTVRRARSLEPRGTRGTGGLAQCRVGRG